MHGENVLAATTEFGSQPSDVGVHYSVFVAFASPSNLFHQTLAAEVLAG
jgi:hypothetical protein